MNKKIVLGSILAIIFIVGIVEFVQQSNSTISERTATRENAPKIEEGESNVSEQFNNKVNITINGKNYTATLEENDTTRKLIEELPLEITMDELNGNEKYYYMDSSLPTESKRVGQIETGDIMLYGSDCLVIFYESFQTKYSYTRIGKIDNPDSLKSVVGKNSIEVTINK